ncbi:MAG TPA: hypothetical protein VHZ49_18915 [Methylomirabilota bacterium]|nr:hypothetical protein [Methylomirabilota bacterium]
MTALALVLLLALLLGAPAADAQIFIASRPAPPFEIGPLFIRANVTPTLGPIEVDVFWSVSVPPGRSLADAQHDISLLWPSAVLGDAKIGKADAELEKYVEARGFDAVDSGRVLYASRNLYGTRSGQWQAIAGGAPFVTYVRSSGAMGLTSPASFIRIPWDPRMLNRAFLMKLTFKTKGLLKDKPGTWAEHTLWGPRHRLTLSFNEVRARGVFPMYFEHRDRMIRLSEDPAQLLIDFADSPHLKIDEMQPAGARRQLSETRDLTDTVSLYIDRGEGLTPQTLSVQFGYFTGLQSWAPVLIPLAFFLAGNLGGVLLRTIAERVSKRWAGRLRFWRDREEPVQRQTGVILDRDTLTRIAPGTTTYQEVLQLCGHDVEERVTLAEPDRKTLVYRGRRIIPHHRRLAGVLAAVTYWDVEDHEVEIIVERDVVRDVQAHVRRSRLSGAEAPA